MKKDSAPKNVESIKDGAVLKESEIADVVFPDGTHLVTAGDTDIVRLSCGGIDVHKKILMAAAVVTDPKTLKAVYYVKKFSSMNQDIIAMAKWFSQYGVKDVVMESTGKYWIPVFNSLEANGINPTVTHPKYVKQIMLSIWLICSEWMVLARPLFLLLIYETCGNYVDTW